MARGKRAVMRAADLIDYIGHKNVSTYAAAADYFLFISLVPILMLLVSLIRFLPIDADSILRMVSSTMPSTAYSVLAPLINSIYRSGNAAFTISIVLTVLSASKAMRGLMRGLDDAYDETRKDNPIVFFLRSCGFMIVFALIIIVSLAVLVYGSQILVLLHSWLPESDFVEKLFSFTAYLRYGATFLILTVMFVVMYSTVPAGKHRMKHQWAGALFSAFAWAACSAVFSLYVSISNFFGAYGYIGMIMVAMMWMYFCLMFLLVGGCINGHIEKTRSYT